MIQTRLCTFSEDVIKRRLCPSQCIVTKEARDQLIPLLLRKTFDLLHQLRFPASKFLDLG